VTKSPLNAVQYVVVTGAVAAGATTVASLIADQWSADKLLEGQIEVHNPFFEDAQHDPERWAFASQAHFLQASAQRHVLLKERMRDSAAAWIVEDRTPFEHTGVYVEAARRLGHLQNREAKLLGELAKHIEGQYVAPAVLIYREMTEDQLVERVRTRGRIGESTDFERLQTIHRTFDGFIESWDRSPVVRIGADLDLFTEGGRHAAIALLSPLLGAAGSVSGVIATNRP